MLLRGNAGAAAPVDLDCDGIKDLVTSLAQGGNFGAVYFFKGFADSVASMPYDSLYPVTNNYGFGWRVATAMVDPDSLGDFLTYRPNTLGGPTLYFYSGCPTIDTIPCVFIIVNDRIFVVTIVHYDLNFNEAKKPLHYWRCTGIFIGNLDSAVCSCLDMTSEWL
jgi:hypothetical protein